MSGGRASRHPLALHQHFPSPAPQEQRDWQRCRTKQDSTVNCSTVQSHGVRYRGGGGESLFSALPVSVHQHSPSLASFRHSQCITGQHGTVQRSANGLCSTEQHRVWGPVSHCQHCPAHCCLVWPYHGSHPSPWSWLHRSNRLTGQHAHSPGVAGLVC